MRSTARSQGGQLRMRFWMATPSGAREVQPQFVIDGLVKVPGDRRLHALGEDIFRNRREAQAKSREWPA